jgi:LAO/AO transport system kinase
LAKKRASHSNKQKLFVLKTFVLTSSMLILKRGLIFAFRSGQRNFSAKLSEKNKALADGILSGDRSALARSITLIESTRLDHQDQSELMLDYLGAICENKKRGFQNNRTFRIGIAGPPGGGKSTLIETIGLRFVAEGHRVAVIPVDPSSHRSGGSVLGDKTRMNELSASDNVYIRACPSKGVLGGIAEKTSDVITLCEYAGYDLIIVETVGLGQSEVEVDQAVDMFVLLVTPGGGDDLQASKKGIMEAVDLLAVTKADGDLLSTAKHTKADYASHLSLMRPKDHLWYPRVQLISSKASTGVEQFMTNVSEFHNIMTTSGHLDEKRRRQAGYWLKAHFRRLVVSEMHNRKDMAARVAALTEHVQNGKLSPHRAARQLLDMLERAGMWDD